MAQLALASWASSRRIAPLPLFLVSFIISLLVFRSSSSTLYTPGTSALYAPPAQPTSSPPIQNTLVIPTFRERPNLAPLVEAIFGALPKAMAEETEVLIVDDDSRDGTEEEVERLASVGWRVGVLTRRGERGLSGAVLRGFERARGSRLLVMDADLQHPPSAIPELLEALTERTPMALGTRYGDGVSMAAGWPLHRRIISWGARILARPLTSASDPMSGFFAIRKDTFMRSQPVSTAGFKLALELLLKAPDASPPAEVAYSFGLRTSGSSKLGAKVMLRYVLQLAALYRWRVGLLWHLAVAALVTAAGMGANKLRKLRGGSRGEEAWSLPMHGVGRGRTRVRIE